jgi:hypothetical protein
LLRLSWPFKEERKRLRPLVIEIVYPAGRFTNDLCSGEQGKVDESMREMAAIEALKSEKSEKEVGHFLQLNETLFILIFVAARIAAAD